MGPGREMVVFMFVAIVIGRRLWKGAFKIEGDVEGGNMWVI